MLNVFEPNDPRLKKYVDSIYFIDKGQGEMQFTSYPSPHTAVGLFRSVAIDVSGNNFTISPMQAGNHLASAFNRLFRPAHMHYKSLLDEIAINFKPLGFAAFTAWQYKGNTDFFTFTAWDNSLKELFDAVFATTQPAERMLITEDFLLKKHAPFADEEILTKAIAMLSDPDSDLKIDEIASQLNVHHKYLYRSFTTNLGSSPAHFRKIVRFRNAVYSKLDKGEAARFIEICYSGNYTDQSYFNKQFRDITGETPKQFFKGLSSFGSTKVVLRFS